MNWFHIVLLKLGLQHKYHRSINKDKKTLVFDLDETLIHCNDSLDKKSDIIIPIKFPNGETINVN